MTTVHQYRIKCSTEDTYKTVWSDTEPTTCPDNNGHTIDTSLTTVLQTVSDEYPISDIDGYKMAVHTSYKPKADNTTYAVWTGAGDDLTTSPHQCGEGDMLHFHMSPQTGSPLVKQIIEKKLQFSPNFGRVWIHEGYLKFEDGGMGDYVEANVVSYATPLTTSGSPLTLYIENNWVKYSTGNPVGTHNFAGTPSLIPRTYSKDGDWDYDGTSLTPNLNGTGGYKISDIERNVHKYFNKIHCHGTSPYFTMTSDETTELNSGYYVSIKAYNNSNTTWHACVLIEIYREQTVVT